MGVIETEESTSQREEEKRGWYRDDASKPDRLSCTGLVGCRQVPLDHGLIRGVGNQVDEDSSEDDDGKRTSREVPIHVHHLEATRRGCSIEELGQTTTHAIDTPEEDQQCTADQDEGLDHVRPDHRFDATEHRVDDAEDPHQKYACMDIESSDRGERDRGEIDHDRHPSELEEKVLGTSEHPDTH